MPNPKEPSYRRNHYPLDSGSNDNQTRSYDKERFQDFIIIGLELLLIGILLVLAIMILTVMNDYTSLIYQ